MATGFIIFVPVLSIEVDAVGRLREKEDGFRILQRPFVFMMVRIPQTAAGSL